MKEYDLHGKVAVITGASKGLGKAMALALGSAGANLALVSRDLEQLNAVKLQVEALGGRAESFQADVSDEEKVRQLERDVIKAFNGVHILINNAGINLRKQLIEFSLERVAHRLQHLGVPGKNPCRGFFAWSLLGLCRRRATAHRRATD